MSTLALPRLYFRGQISWDPAVSNNSRPIYDGEKAAISLPPGVTFEEFPRWIMGLDSKGRARCGWNLYGLFSATFINCKITGGVLPNGSMLITDPIVGGDISFSGSRPSGRLVDLDPATTWNSQIFFEGIQIKGPKVQISRKAGSKPQRRMNSRGINFQRNFNMPIAGVASTMWQTCFATNELDINDPGTSSQLVTAFRAALSDPGTAGLMLRFCTYRTEYFKNGIYNRVKQTPRNDEELSKLYLANEIFANPAYSLVVGTIGIWNTGEPVSAPSGRKLVPTREISPQNTSLPAVRLAPVFARFDSKRNSLALDLANTFPELDVHAEKADFGPFSLGVVDRGNNFNQLATIPYDQYSKEAYERTCGILDLDLSGIGPATKVQKLLSDGDLSLRTSGAIEAMRERRLTATVDERDIYIDQLGSPLVDLRVWDRGAPAPDGTLVILSHFDKNLKPSQSMAATASQTVVQTASGRAAVTLTATQPGFSNYLLQAIEATASVPAPPPMLDPTVEEYLCARVLPFDNDLESSTPNEQLTWNFIYEQILRLYDLLTPGMSKRVFPLGDEPTVKNNVPAILALTDAGQLENPLYMPVTRDLSAGKRKLLQRWCNLVQSQSEPSGASNLAMLISKSH